MSRRRRRRNGQSRSNRMGFGGLLAGSVSPRYCYTRLRTDLVQCCLTRRFGTSGTKGGAKPENIYK